MNYESSIFSGHAETQVNPSLGLPHEDVIDEYLERESDDQKEDLAMMDEDSPSLPSLEAFSQDSLGELHQTPDITFNKDPMNQLNEDFDAFGLVDHGDWHNSANHSLFQSGESTTSPGWESEEEKASQEPSEQITSEESLPESTQSVDSQDRCGRGRPRHKKEIPTEDLLVSFINFLVSKFSKIEKSAEEDSGNQTSRNRDDKPRTKIIRLCKTLPTFFLKLLVSVGDYKHSDAARLNESYEKAYDGFKNIIKCLNLTDSLRTDLCNLKWSNILALGAIAFPMEKVCTVAKYRDEGDRASIESFMAGRQATSVKKIKEQIEKNPMFSLLFKVTFKALEEKSEDFPISMRILEELATL